MSDFTKSIYNGKTYSVDTEAFPDEKDVPSLEELYEKNMDKLELAYHLYLRAEMSSYFAEFWKDDYRVLIKQIFPEWFEDIEVVINCAKAYHSFSHNKRNLLFNRFKSRLESKKDSKIVASIEKVHPEYYSIYRIISDFKGFRRRRFPDSQTTT